jgi:TonB-dependent receptor
MKQSITLILISTFLSFSTFAQGVISGKVVDGKTGETLIGATIAVENSPLGAQTDLDGNFTIPKVPKGRHNVVIRYVGYKEKKHEDVEVKDGSITSLYETLNEDAMIMQEAVITATVTKKDNASAIFLMQRNATTIQSGISAEDMKRSPDRSSGEVIRRVSGATIQDGKFAVIRGLADRYNMALINNVILPSTEPDRKAFAFDVFPTNILDNIIIMKTGQPDLPSEWAGGLIQLNTRDIPEKSFFNVTIGQTFTEGTTFKPYKTYEGSKTDFLGFDNSTRKLPKTFPGIVDLNNTLLTRYSDTNSVKTLVGLGKSINNTSWKVREKKMAYPGQNLQMSGGFAVHKTDIQAGGVFALSYSNNLKFSEGSRTRYDAADRALYYDYTDDKYNNSVAASLLANLGVLIKNNHKITWKTNYTVNSDNTVYQREGINYFSASEQRRTNLEFISSRVFSTNLGGEHMFKPSEIKWRWNGGAVFIQRDQPKTMRYSYERFYSSPVEGGPNTVNDPYLYQIQNGGSDPKLSALFYSQLNEKAYNASTDLSVPFKINAAKQFVKFGYSFQYRQRNFEARNLFFDYTSANYSSDTMLRLPVDEIINQQNFDKGKLILNQVAFPTDVYKASSNTHAAFVMMENNIGKFVKAVWGFRFENFKQNLTAPTSIGFNIIPNPDGGPPTITTKLTDSTYVKSYYSGAYKADSVGNVKPVFPVLPSLNLIFKLNESMNIRASYSQSMSRPEFREVSSFLYYDFVRDVNLGGNVNLLQTFIHNADLRYEYFLGKGQAINASVFYKHFTNTIELTTIPAGGVQQFIYSNAQSAYLVGAEVEVRKNFDFISPKLEALTFSANLAYIYSRVNLDNVRNNSGEEKVRSMQGQSPYIVNLGLSYLHPKIGFGTSLLYNQVGHRLYAVGEVGNPSWYENYRPLLDLQFSQKFWKDKAVVRFTISDIIAKSTIFYQNDKPDTQRQYQKTKDAVVQSEKNYRSYTLQLSFNF